MVLKCLLYNYNTTETCSDSYEKCAREITCPDEDGYHCFVVWQVGANASAISAGCNPRYSAAPEESKRCGDECIGTSTRPRNYCCCSKNFCNRNFKLPPNPIVPPTLPVPLTNNTNSINEANNSLQNINNLHSTDSVLWAVIPIILIVIIVLTYIYKYEKRILKACSLGKIFNDNNNASNNNISANVRRNDGRDLTASELNELRINNSINNNEFSILTPFRKAFGDNNNIGDRNGAQSDFAITNNNINKNNHHMHSNVNNNHHLYNHNQHQHNLNNHQINHNIDQLNNINNLTNLSLTNHHEANNHINKIDLKSITLLEVIGSGRFGKVHRAKIQKQLATINSGTDTNDNRKNNDNKNISNDYNNISNDEDTNNERSNSNSVDDDLNEIAVKIISSNDHQSWLNEQQVYSLPKIRHENILNYLYSDIHLETQNYWLIVEYASKGSLYCYLKDNLITWKEFLKISLGIVHGLSHLHEADIAHRDFKSKNVLLKGDLTPCITDFGVAAILDTTTGSQLDHRKKYLQVGTPRYMAPEVLECSVTFTKSSFTKIDVYALSLVLWELISRCYSEREINENSHLIPPYKLPFEDIVGPNPDINEMRQIVVVDKIRPVLKDEWRIYPASEFCRAIEDGWEYDHDARISASCFVERVESLPNSF